MNNRSSYLIKYFGDRFILLREEWLTAAIEFVQSRVPQSQHYSNEKFADLIFEQWKCAGFEESSFPIFANHGINPSTSKMDLQGPIVCQINSIIDISTPYFSQYRKLEDKSIEDNSGFEKVFQEKEDDSDKKISRMLQLTLTDGETTLSAIEFWKIPHLSMYIKPGCKFLITPPVRIRKGIFLLKSSNCQILGGECLPALYSQTPLQRYKQILGISCDPPERNMPELPTVEIRHSNSFDDDYFPNTQDFNDVLQQEGSSSPPSIPPVVTVSSFSNPLDSEALEFSKKSNSPPRKRLKQSTIVNILKPSGMLTSRQCNPRDEELENMIEKDEEPISIVSHPIRKSIEKPVQVRTVPDMAKVKVEKDDDDDIEIIVLDTPSPSVSEKIEKENEKDGLTNEEKDALAAFLKISFSVFTECARKMKYCIGSRRFSIMAVIDDIVEPLRVVDNLWTMKVNMKDESGSEVCFVDNATLESLIGFSCHEAIEIRKSSDMEKRKDGKRRLQALEQQLQRLDLVFEVEFFNGSLSVPVIRNIKTMSDKLDAY